MPVPPFLEVRIENTNSCGYKCVMCPRESQTRSLGYMSIDDFSLILDRIAPFQGAFHLHGFGEALLDRKLTEKLALLKKKCPASPSVIFSTLGVRVKEGYFETLLAAGLTDLAVSFYGFTRENYRKVHGFDGFELAKKNLESLGQAMKRFPGFQATLKVPGANATATLAVAEPSEKTALIDWAKGLGFDVKPWNFVHNYGSGRAYNAPNEKKMCPVIDGMRKHLLNITWDLNVIPCCYDFNATIRFGNLRKSTLEEIFSSPEYLNFVIAHKTYDLSNYPVCSNCEKSDYV